MWGLEAREKAERRGAALEFLLDGGQHLWRKARVEGVPVRQARPGQASGRADVLVDELEGGACSQARRTMGIKMTLLTTERLLWHCGAHTAEPKNRNMWADSADS